MRKCPIFSDGDSMSGVRGVPAIDYMWARIQVQWRSVLPSQDQRCAEYRRCAIIIASTPNNASGRQLDCRVQRAGEMRYQPAIWCKVEEQNWSPASVGIARSIRMVSKVREFGLWLHACEERSSFGVEVKRKHFHLLGQQTRNTFPPRYSGLRNRCPDAQGISCSRPHTAAAGHHPLSSERTSSALCYRASFPSYKADPVPPLSERSYVPSYGESYARLSTMVFCHYTHSGRAPAS